MGSNSKGKHSEMQAVIVSWYEMSAPFPRAGLPAWFLACSPPHLPLISSAFIHALRICFRKARSCPVAYGEYHWPHHPWLSVPCSVQLAMNLNSISHLMKHTLCDSIAAWHLTSQYIFLSLIFSYQMVCFARVNLSLNSEVRSIVCCTKNTCTIYILEYVCILQLHRVDIENTNNKPKHMSMAKLKSRPRAIQAPCVFLLIWFQV
jgi:hypothetical protein